MHVLGCSWPGLGVLGADLCTNDIQHGSFHFRPMSRHSHCTRAYACRVTKTTNGDGLQPNSGGFQPNSLLLRRREHLVHSFLHTSFPATSTDCEVAFMWQRAIVRMNSKISHPCHSLTEFATTEGLGVRNRPPRRTGLARTVEVQDEDE